MLVKVTLFNVSEAKNTFYNLFNYENCTHVIWRYVHSDDVRRDASAIHAFRGSDFTEPHIAVTTSAEDSVTITLASDVMDGDNTNIIVTSSNPADAPVPFSYDSANRQLAMTV